MLTHRSEGSNPADSHLPSQSRFEASYQAEAPDFDQLVGGVAIPEPSLGPEQYIERLQSPDGYSEAPVDTGEVIDSQEELLSMFEGKEYGPISFIVREEGGEVHFTLIPPEEADNPTKSRSDVSDFDLLKVQELMQPEVMKMFADADTFNQKSGQLSVVDMVLAEEGMGRSELESDSRSVLRGQNGHSMLLQIYGGTYVRSHMQEAHMDIADEGTIHYISAFSNATQAEDELQTELIPGVFPGEGESITVADDTDPEKRLTTTKARHVMELALANEESPVKKVYTEPGRVYRAFLGTSYHDSPSQSSGEGIARVFIRGTVGQLID